MKKLKMVWLFPHLEEDGGGTKFLLETAKRLRAHYNIKILCNTGTKSVISQFQKERISVRTTSFISANSNIYWLLMPIFIGYDFISYLTHVRQSDYIVSTMFPSNIVASVCAFVLKKPHYHYCYEPFPYLHDKYFMQSQPIIKGIIMSIFSFLYSWMDVYAVRAARKTFTLNKVTQQMIKKTYNVTAIITYMGVDAEHFKKYRKSKIQSAYDGRPIVIHSTDYSIMKRTDLAISAIRDVVRKRPKTLLIITSTRPFSTRRKIYLELVQKYHLEKNVIFANYISYADLPKYYSASMCYLSTSYDKMLGTSSSNLPVKEALACETPAIRANVTDEDVVDGVSGFLVDPRDTKSVANKIVNLIDNREMAEQMGRMGRKMIVKNYTWNKVARVIMDNLK